MLIAHCVVFIGYIIEHLLLKVLKIDFYLFFYFFIIIIFLHQAKKSRKKKKKTSKRWQEDFLRGNQDNTSNQEEIKKAKISKRWYRKIIFLRSLCKVVSVIGSYRINFLFKH